MQLTALFALGVAAASVASGAPATTSTLKKQEVSLMHTVVIEDDLAEPTGTADAIPTEFGAAVGYGVALPSETEDVESTAELTSTSEEAEVPLALAEPAIAPSDQPVAVVVPVRICVNKEKNCLTTLGSEFANVDLSWDNLADFNLGPDGLLVRLNDLKCVDALPMDDNTWYDLAYVDCTLPNYLQGAVQLPGNGIGNTTVDEPTTGDDRAATLTAAVSEPTPTVTEEAAPALEMHTIWFYKNDTQQLCANVNDGLNDIAMACLYQDEGYAMLGTQEDLKRVSAKNRQVTLPVVHKHSIAEELTLMLRAMTYDGSVFWADAWTTNLDQVMKYRMMGVQEENISMSKDEITGAIFPLWQVINDCRTTCDTYFWCKSFQFQIFDRVCKLSSVAPKVNPDQVDKKNPDTVTFVQNANYKREDYVLPEEIVYETPKPNRRVAMASMRARRA